MKKMLILLAAMVALNGCASQIIWTKDSGYSEEEFKRDNYQCVQESKTYWSGGGTGLIGVAAMVSAATSAQQQAKQLYKMCMDAKGYRILDPNREASTGMIANPNNLTIVRVIPYSPADKGGIRPDDIIVERDGCKVTCLADLKLLPKLVAGRPVNYKFLRNGKEMEITLTPVPISSLNVNVSSPSSNADSPQRTKTPTATENVNPKNPVSAIQPQHYKNEVQKEQGCFVKETNSYINPGETFCKDGTLLECKTNHGWKVKGNCQTQ